MLRGIDRASRRAAFLGNDHQVLLTSPAQWLHQVRLAPQGHRRIGTHDSTDWRFAFPKAECRSGNILACDAQQRLTIYREDGTSEDLPDEPIARRAGFQLSPDSRWLASTNWVKGKQGKCVARVYDATAKLQQVIELPDMQRPTPVFGPDDDEMLLIDCRESEAVSAEVWIPDGSGSWQKARRTCRAPSSRPVPAPSPSNTTPPHARSRSAVRAPAARLYRWDSVTAAAAAIRPAAGRLRWNRRIAFSPDGELLLLACSDRVVRLVDRAGNLQMPPLTGHLGTIVSIGISPRSNRILIAADESGITVHDIHGKLMLPIRPLRGTVQAAAFLPDGKHVLFSTTDCVTRAPCRSSLMRFSPPHREW